tara:strand:- start:812 stop:1120 length:309 start_codon:yes stop_codon:yes gene_type:complete
MKKQNWIILVLVLILAIYLFNDKGQYSPEGCNEYQLLDNVQQDLSRGHTAKLESEQRDLAVISIDNTRELFQGYSPNYYDFGKVRISFYGPQDDKLTIEVCI